MADVVLKTRLDGARKVQTDFAGIGAKAKGAGDQASASFRRMGESVRLIEGPLGGVAGRFTVLSGALGTLGFAGAGLVATLAAVGLGLTKAVTAGRDYETQMLRINGVLRATSNAVGLTAKEIDDFAKVIGRATLASTADVRSAAGIVLTFKSIQGDAFKQTLTLAQSLADVMGVNIKQAALQLSKALEDPITQLSALRRNGVSFTDAQKEMIQSMAEAGDKAGAQTEIFKILETQLKGVSERAAGGMAGAWDTLGEAMTEFFETISKRSGLVPALTTAIKSLGEAVDGAANLISGGTFEERIASLDASIDRLAGMRNFFQSLTGGSNVMSFIVGQGDIDMLLKIREKLFTEHYAAIEVEHKKQLKARFDAEVASQDAIFDQATSIIREQEEENFKATATRIQKVQKEEEEQIKVLLGLRKNFKSDVGFIDKAIDNARLAAIIQISKEKAKIEKKELAELNKIRREKVKFAKEEIKDVKAVNFTIQDQIFALQKLRTVWIAKGLSGSKGVEAINKEMRTLNRQLSVNSNGVLGFKAAIGDFTSSANNNFANMRAFANSAFGSMRDSLANFFLTGKFGMADFVNVMKAELAKLAATKIISGILGGIGGGGGGGAGGFIGGLLSGIGGGDSSGGGGGIGGLVGNIGSSIAQSAISKALGIPDISTALSGIFGGGATLGGGAGVSGLGFNVGASGIGAQTAVTAAGTAALGGGAGVSGLGFGVGASGIGAQTAVPAGFLASAAPFLGAAAAAGIAAYGYSRLTRDKSSGPAEIIGAMAPIIPFLNSGGSWKDYPQLVQGNLSQLKAMLNLFTGNHSDKTGTVASIVSRLPAQAIATARRWRNDPALTAAIYDKYEQYSSQIPEEFRGPAPPLPPGRGPITRDFEHQGFATGGSRLFTRPTLLSVAEQGPEFVSARPTAHSPTQGPGTSVVFQGPAIVDAISLDRFVRSVDRATKRRAGRGV